MLKGTVRKGKGKGKGGEGRRDMHLRYSETLEYQIIILLDTRTLPLRGYGGWTYT